MIALCLPTRGVGHLRSVFSALAELRHYEHRLCPAIGYPLPEANNIAAALALADPHVSHLWFVEDDNLIGAGVLADLLALDAPVAAADYLLRNGLSCVLRTDGDRGAAVLCGFGCTLIRRDVFDALPWPPFTTGTRLVWDGGWKDSGVPELAGGHDAHFCRDLLAAGLRIAVLEGSAARVGHLDLVRAGSRSNLGMDEVICYGGSPALPYYPLRKERTMAEEWWLAPSGQTVLGLDPDKGADTAFYEKNGWTKVKKADAAPILKAQQERDAAQLAGVLAEEGVEPEPKA